MRLVLVGITVTFFILTPTLTAQEGEAPPAVGSEARVDASHAKDAWDWTREERISARLNPAQQQARRARALESGAVLREHITVLDGSLEPELFLPEELYRIFLKEVLAPDPVNREFWRKDVEREYQGQLPDDFWSQFDEITAKLQLVMDEQNQVLRHASESPREQVEADLGLLRAQLCELRRETIDEVRALLPPGKFDRLLYEGVTPGLKVHESVDSAPELMRRGEEGC